MSAIYDNWERLVDATLLREKLRHLGRIDSFATSESAGSFFNDPLSEASLNFRNLGYKFSYQHLLQATSSFSKIKLIERGSSGDLFRGDFPDYSLLFTRDNKILGPGSSVVVVKRIDLSLVSNREAYLYELDFFTKVWQVKFFAYLGHCLEKENEKFLVYKYMPNGDLSSSLFKKKNANKDELMSLDWITRMKIAIGAAEGLAYLHDECHPPLVHGDVQASSILLDDNFEVRLGSLSKSGAQVSGTRYFDDWIFRESDRRAMGTPEATRANDVHCFGKVLLELVTGKLGISAPSANNAMTNEWLETTILRHVSINDKVIITEIVDPSLIIDVDLLEEVWSMAIVAKSCLDPEPEKRPLMTHILKALESPFELVRAVGTGYKAIDAYTESWAADVLGNYAGLFYLKEKN